MLKTKRGVGMFCLALLLSATLIPAGASATKPSPRLVETTAVTLTIGQLTAQNAMLRKTLRDLKATAAATGSIRVAVKLPVAFAPETLLRNAEKQQQRADIEAAVRALRASLPLARNLEAVPGLPYVRLTLDHAGLTRLETIPGLTRVTRAEEMNWQRDFVELTQAAMMAARGPLPAAQLTAPGQLEEVSAMVVGGRNADPGTHPFMVAMVAKEVRNDFAAQFCGGVLVAPRFVLTARHCFEGQDGNYVQVLVGSQRLDGSGRRIDVARIHLHPGISYTSAGWALSDIAVVELSTPVRNIPFARLATTPPTTIGTPLRVTGWGLGIFDGQERKPINLQQVDVPFIACPYGGYADEFCAGARDRDSCGYDSGGPLTINRGRGYTEVVGLVRGGAGYPGSPIAFCGGFGFYTSIAHPTNLSFINSIVVDDNARGFKSPVIWAKEMEEEDGTLVPIIPLRRASAVGRLELDITITQSGRTLPRSGSFFFSQDVLVRAKAIFPAGSLDGSVSFLPLGDDIPEPTESVTITLLGAPQGWNTRTTVMIVDDDGYQRPNAGPIVTGSSGQ